jgi:hypothetical protein
MKEWIQKRIGCRQCTKFLTVARVKNSVLCYKTSCSLAQTCRRAVTAEWCHSPHVQYKWAFPSERGKSTVVPIRAMTADVCLISFLALALDGREWSTLLPGKKLLYSLSSKLGGPHSWSGHFGREKKTRHFRMVQPVALSPISSNSKGNQKQQIKRQG